MKFLTFILFLFLGSCDLGKAASGKQIVNPDSPKGEANAENIGRFNVDTLVARVAERYGNLASYRSRIVNDFRSQFNGSLTKGSEYTFYIEYVRGKRAKIEWQENGEANTFRLEGGKAWLERDGKLKQRFSSPGSGIGMISTGDGLRYRFMLNPFVFRDELGMGPTFFAGLQELRVIGEEEIDGERCQKLSGSFRGVDATMTFWIGQETSLIRQLEKIVTVRTVKEGEEYVGIDTLTERYSDIVVN